MLDRVRCRRALAAGAAAAVIAAPGTAPASPAAAAGLGDYAREVDLLVATPATTASAAGGLFNPAAWGVQPSGGLFLGWDDAAGSDQLAGVLSLRHVAFGLRHWKVAPAAGGRFRTRDYTIGIAGGTRAHAWGLSYAWGGGDLERQPRHERLVTGTVYRCRWGALGSTTTWDLERRDHQLQMDIGLRPLGPRVTLFADAVYRRGESFADIRTGYGLEARPLPGLALAAKARSSGEIGLRLGVALDRHAWLGVRTHLDDRGDRTATTYAVDVGAAHASLPVRLLPRRYPELELRGPFVYQRYRWFDRGRTLLGTLQGIDALAAEPEVGGVLVNLSRAQLGPATAWELRAQLAGLRAHGKKVLVYCDRPGLYQLHLASVADEVWLDPTGLVDASGLASGSTYMRHALDKLGLGVDEWRFFTYKSAFENYSRDSMSDPEREQRQALVDDFYTGIAAAIGAARGIDPARFDALVDGPAVLRPEEARAAGLVDSLGDFAAMRRAAPRTARRPGGGEPAAALADLVVDPVWREEAWGEPPRLALLYAVGPCEMETGIRARTLARAVRAAADDRRVEAIVLRVDSPGGDVLPSDLVAREVRDAARRKPVIVSQGQVAASGGYWISMYADTILASPFTLTGSIGVIGGWIWNRGLGDKIGLDYDGVRRGAHADLPYGIRLPWIGITVPDRPLRPDERDRAEQLLRATYGDFVANVAAGRGLPEARVDALGQGRVWSGGRARDNGLVDAVGGLWDGLRLARGAAGLAPGRAVRIEPGPDIGAFDFRALWRRLIPTLSTGEDGAEVATPSAPSALAPWLDPAEPPALAPSADPAEPPSVRDASLWSAAENALLRTLLRHNGRPLVLLPPLEIRDGAPAP